jgi:8-oxo-dGTP pyrophosphatase MutT (NUDIX family)
MPTYPNMLDSTVAGGVPASETPFENIIQEANEEASLPTDLVRHNIKSTGVLTYISRTDEGARAEPGLIIPDIVYLYDIELSSDVIPRPHDTEVKEFELMSVDKVKTHMRNKEFKTNSAVVMIDFFIRHGIITNDNEKDFVEINMRMHRGLPFKTTSRQRGNVVTST